jgi:hypothetical protein
MKDVTTALPCKLWSQVSLPDRPFSHELLAFKKHFSF